MLNPRSLVIYQSWDVMAGCIHALLDKKLCKRYIEQRPLHISALSH